MPQNDNLSAPFSWTTSGLVGAPSSSISGLVIGTKQAGKAISNASDLFSEKQSERDSLLAALDALYGEQKDIKDIPGLNLFPDLKESLEASANGIGSVVSRALVVPTGLVSNLTQIPLDLSTAIHAILNSVADPQKFSREDATTLRVQQELDEKQSGFSAHCQALSEEFHAMCRKLDDEINKNIGEGDFARVHVTAARSSASIIGGVSLATFGLMSAGLDAIGAIFRESTALQYFSKQECKSAGEKNIYHAISACCAEFSESKPSAEALQSLRNLEEALSNFNDANKLSMAHGASTPNISVFVRLLISGPFVATLRSVNSAAIALSEANDQITAQKDRSTQALGQTIPRASTIKELKDDRINHSQNLSDLSHEFDRLTGAIDVALQHAEIRSDRKSIATSGTATAGISSAFTAIPLLVTDFVGIISREFIGAIYFTQHDKGTQQESKQVSATRKDKTGADLDALMARVSQLKERVERCEKLGVSAPVTLGVSHIVSCGALIGTLNSVMGMCFALSELKSLSHNENVATKLDEEEKQKALEYKDSCIASNKKSAQSSGSESLSENVSLHDRLQTIMEKVVLFNRSKLNFLQPGMEREDLNSTAKSTIAFSQGNSTGFLSGAMGTLALVGLESGIGTEALFHVLSLGCIQMHRLSDGVDNIKTGPHSKFNASFISNAIRLSADKTRSSVVNVASQSSYHVAESIASRSVIVALCHSGALTAELRSLCQQERENLLHHPHFLDSVLVSAKVMDQLAEKILAVLNNADQADRQVPGLNGDMASEIASMSQAGIATALSVHSSLISPFLQSYAATQAARQIEVNEKNEALSQSGLSKPSSQILNIIQAFTKNCIDQFKNHSNEQDNAALLKMPTAHITSNQAFAGSMVASCCLSLLCDELIEISLSRSLTLLDKEQLNQSSDKTNKESKLESKDASQRSAEDSDAGQSQSATRGVSALRLTLSHLGHSMVRVAKEMQKECDRIGDQFVQRNLKLHSSQETLMSSVVSSLSKFGVSLLQLSGMLSMLPLSSAGFVDDVRQFIHACDPDLQFTRVQTSAGCTKDSSCSEDLSLITGLATDAVMDVVVNLTKLLLRAALIGSDISLSVAKVLEVLSLHHRPEEALSLESKQLSMPNKLSKNLHTQSQFATVGTSVASAIISNETKRSDASCNSMQSCILSLQAVADETIDNCTLIFDEDQSSLNLKSFYEILIRVLAQHENMADPTPENCQNLADRFNRGGISLSSYHSTHCGLPGNPQEEKVNNPLLQNDLFLGCDDARSLLDCFIRKATANELAKPEGHDSLLMTMKKALMPVNKPLSHRAKELWTFVVEKVADNVYLKDERSQFFRPRNERREKFDKEALFQIFTEGVREYKAEQPHIEEHKAEIPPLNQPEQHGEGIPSPR